MDLDSTDWPISGGMDVHSSDGEKFGEVADVGEDFLVVSEGALLPTTYYVPIGAIGNVDEAVHLTVTRDDALNLGWDQLPASLMGGAGDERPFVDAGLHVDNPVLATAAPGDEVTGGADEDATASPGQDATPPAGA